MKHKANPKWKKVRRYTRISSALLLFLPAVISVYVQKKQNITSNELISDINPAVLIIWVMFIVIAGLIYIYANYKDPSNIKNSWYRFFGSIANTDKKTSFTIWKMSSGKCPYCFSKLSSNFASKCPSCTADI